MFGLTKKEELILRKLNTPIKIQDFLDALPINHEKKGETVLSPRMVLKKKKAHCFEGAMLAATALWLQGKKPLLMDLHALPEDDDHVVALYKMNGYWGAISKTNHSALRFRDPIYRTLRELALSYFSEYFMCKTGKKTLREYSVPFDLSKWGHDWITSEENLFDIAYAIQDIRHFKLVPKKNKRYVRNAGKMEIRTGDRVEWSKSNPRT